MNSSGIDFKQSSPFTRDTFYNGRIKVLQSRNGYRFSIDAPLLADFIQTKKNDVLLELGTGNGIISLLLSPMPFKHITALEIQDSLFGLALKNVEMNNLSDKISVINRDFKSFRPGHKYDIIFSNPPYIKQNTGRLSASREKTIAKHEVSCSLDDILETTACLMKKRGRACFIYPEKRRTEFLTAAIGFNLQPSKIRSVHPRSDTPSVLFLIELIHAEGKNEKVRASKIPNAKRVALPPLILYKNNGTWSDESKRIFSGL
jgi:tRNA1(Val) A37 N6-methylase TrmN6